MMSKNRFSCPLREWPVSQANACCVITRWPSLETGRNSVMPWTTPRISDSIHSIVDQFLVAWLRRAGIAPAR